MDTPKLLHHHLSIYLTLSLTLIRRFLTILRTIPLNHFPPIFVPIADLFLSIYFHYIGLTSYTVDLDSTTTLHFWIPAHRRHNKPNLVLIHGYGADARWQFFLQIHRLSKSFNVYVPDLLFFGGSHTSCGDRSVGFQAKCVMDGLRKGLGVEKCCVYAISYGGWVGCKMAEMCGKEVVERVVVVSSGVGCTVEEMERQVKRVGRGAEELLVPGKAEDLKMLVKVCTRKFDPKWIPDYFFREFIHVMHEKHKQERTELVEYLMKKEANANPPVLTQETLLIWGDQDNVFPRYLAYDLLSHLGSKARLEIIKDCGHAANIDAPQQVNQLIESFVLGSSSEH